MPNVCETRSLFQIIILKEDRPGAPEYAALQQPLEWSLGFYFLLFLFFFLGGGSG